MNLDSLKLMTTACHICLVSYMCTITKCDFMLIGRSCLFVLFAVLTLLNPAPAISDLGCDVCQNVDIICLNETESEIITGMTVTSIDDARAVTSVLLERGCRAVIVTLGAQGAVFATKDETKAIHMPARSVEAVDTTVSANLASRCLSASCFPLQNCCNVI